MSGEKKLADKSAAVLFLNNGNTNATITCNAQCFGELGWSGSQVLKVRDLWQHKDLGTVTVSQGYSPSVMADGGSLIFKFTPQ